MTGQSDGRLDLAAVRVHDAAGDVVGAGFIIGPNLVVTCAHVVTTAVGGDPEGARPPAAPVLVDFPMVDNGHTVAARVLRWWPIQADGGGDVAVLELDERVPWPARVPPLRRAEGLWGRPFRLLGFPEYLTDGVWASGEFRDLQPSGWVQLQSAPGEPPVEGGFSGAAVWDADTGAVVGMAVAAVARREITSAFVIPIEQVLGVDPGLLPNPYRGLEPFHEEHADFFCGRDEDVERVATVLDRGRVAVIAGRSGTGKSSLVRAGLMPRLRRRGALIAEFRPSGGPADLVPVLVSVLEPNPSNGEQEALARRLAERIRAGDEVGEEISSLLDGRELVLFADQFEELAADRPADALGLVRWLIGLVDAVATVRVVLTVRWEAMNDLMASDVAETLNDATVPLASMRRTQLREAITGPTVRAPGLFFESGLVERILDDTGAEPGRLPLLESLLAQLWEERDGGMLTAAGYERLGGVGGAVVRRAEQAWTEFDSPAGQTAARRLLTKLAKPAAGGEDFGRTMVAVATLSPDLSSAASRLARHRLVVLGQDAQGEEVVELAHQALIEHWPRLRDWLVQDRDFLTWQHQLEQRCDAWELSGMDSGGLLRGGALLTALDWLAAREPDVSGQQRTFIRASRARHRREVRRWRLVAAVLLVLVLVAGVLSVVVVDRNAELGTALDEANAKTLAEEAMARGQRNPDTAAQFALAAYRADRNSPQARTALGRAYLATQSASQVLTGVTDEPIEELTVSQDGDAALVPHRAGHAVVSGLSGTQPRTWVPPKLPKDADLTLSPDGRYLAGLDDTNTLLLWEIGQDGAPRVLADGGEERTGAGTLSFAPDGRRLLWFAPTAAGWTGLHIWDLVRHREVRHDITAPPGVAVTGAWQTADPELVVLRYGEHEAPAGETADPRLVVRELAGGKEIRTLPPGSVVVGRGASAVRCEPGRRGDETNDYTEVDAKLRVFRTADEKPVRELPTFQPDDCGEDGLDSPFLMTMDGAHLMSYGPIARELQNAVLTFYSLVDGNQFDLVVPPQWGVGAEPSNGPFRMVTDIGVLRPRGGAPALVLAHGTSLYRYDGPFATSPVARERYGPLPTADGRYVVAAVPSEDPADNGDFVSIRADTGAQLAKMSADTIPASEFLRPEVVGDTFVLTTRSPGEDHAVVYTYSIPDLKEIASYELPPAASKGANGVAELVPDVDIVGDRLYALSGGVVSTWHLPTGERATRSFPVATDPEEVEWLQSEVGNPHFVTRPDHAGEITVVTKTGEFEIWNIESGKRVAQLNTRIRTDTTLPWNQYAISRNGRYLAFIDSTDTVQVWDIDAGEPARSALPTGEPGQLAGFDAADNLIVHSAVGDAEFSLWNIHDGRQVGPFQPGAGGAGELTIGADQLSLGTLAPPFPLDPERWFARLCAIQDRPYTKAERPILPPGASQDPPCDR